MQAEGVAPDVITFAGNGEPTLHPEFGGIISDTIQTRNRFFPKAKIAVLSNSTQLHREEVFQALNQIEDNIMKLDSVLDSRSRQLNAPNQPGFTFEKLMEGLCRFQSLLHRLPRGQVALCPSLPVQTTLTIETIERTNLAIDRQQIHP